MVNVLLLGLLTGLDNFIVSAGLGTTVPRRRQIVALVAAFAAAEALMPLVGFALVRVAAPGLFEGLGPVLLILAGLVVGVRCLLGMPRLSPWFLLTVPVLMALDNLAAGAGLGALGGHTPGTALGTGLTAALLGTAGLLVGRRIPLGAPALAQAVVALCLISVGLLDLAGEA